MSKTIEIRVPDIGDFSGVPVIEILVAEGDQVATEDSLVTLESDKATMEVPSPADGIIREIKVKLDDTVSEGDLVAVLETSAVAEETTAAVEASEKTEAPVPEKPAVQKDPPAPQGTSSRTISFRASEQDLRCPERGQCSSCQSCPAALRA